MLMAWLLGVKIESAGFFPAHYVELSGRPSLLQSFLISFGSSLFPLLCMVIPFRNRVGVYYFRLTVLLLWLFSSIESVINVMLFFAGNIKIPDDAVAVLRFYHQEGWVVLSILLLQIAVSAVAIRNSRPLKTTITYFESLIQL